MARDRFDIAIVGGSFAGLAQALALSRSLGPGLRVAVADRSHIGQPKPGDADDPRAVAVSASSRRLLRALGIWAAVEPQAEPVTRIEITDSDLDAGIRPVLLAWDNTFAGIGRAAGGGQATAEPAAKMAKKKSKKDAANDDDDPESGGCSAGGREDPTNPVPWKTVGFALALGFIAARMRLPPLIGYLLAGVAIGPFTPGFVADTRLAGELAEIGVILLMFGVGLHFSLGTLLKVRTIALRGTQQEGTPAVASPDDTAATDKNRAPASETAVFKSFDILAKIPIEGALAKRLGTDTAAWDRVTNHAYGDPDPKVRRSAVEAGMKAFEADEALRGRVMSATNGMTDVQLAAFARSHQSWASRGSPSPCHSHMSRSRSGEPFT